HAERVSWVIPPLWWCALVDVLRAAPRVGFPRRGPGFRPERARPPAPPAEGVLVRDVRPEPPGPGAPHHGDRCRPLAVAQPVRVHRIVCRLAHVPAPSLVEEQVYRGHGARPGDAAHVADVIFIPRRTSFRSRPWCRVGSSAVRALRARTAWPTRPPGCRSCP